MRKLVVTLVAITALLAGFYLSARHFSEPIVVAQPASGGTLLGSYRPDFQLCSSAGVFVTPADYAGKTVLINFWASWCLPCVAEFPSLMALKDSFVNEPFEVLAINMGEDDSAITSFVGRLDRKLNFPILIITLITAATQLIIRQW